MVNKLLIRSTLNSKKLGKKKFHIKVSAVKFELVFSFIFLQSSYSKGDQLSLKIATAIQTP